MDDVEEFFQQMKKENDSNISSKRQKIEEIPIKEVKIDEKQKFVFQNEEEFKSFVQRNLNNLEKESLDDRKRSLIEIRGLITENYKDYLQKPLWIVEPILKCFSNTSEYCREISTIIILKLIDISPSNDYINCIEIINTRMDYSKESSIQFIEQSEEIRKNLIKILLKIAICTDKDLLNSKIDDHFKKTIIHCFEDYHEIIKLGCECTIMICLKVPDSIALFSPVLIENLTPNLTHHRSDIRILSLKTFKHLILCNGDPYIRKLEPILVNLCFDKNFDVKEELYLLLEIVVKNLSDAHQYLDVLIYLLLLLMSEESDLNIKSYKFLIQLSENYYKKDSQEEATKFDLKLIPPILTKSSFEMKRMMIENSPKILNKITNKLYDLNVNIRKTFSKIFTYILFFIEDFGTKYIKNFLETFINTRLDDVLNEEMSYCFYLTSNYVEPNLIFETLFSIEPSKFSQYILILHDLIKASKNEIVFQWTSKILKFLSTERIVQSKDSKKEIIEILNELIDREIFTKFENKIQFFYVLIKYIPQVKGSSDIVDKLARKLNLSTQELFIKFYDQSASLLTKNIDKWERLPQNMSIFNYLIQNTGPFVFQKSHHIFNVLSTQKTNSRAIWKFLEDNYDEILQNGSKDLIDQMTNLKIKKSN